MRSSLLRGVVMAPSPRRGRPRKTDGETLTFNSGLNGACGFIGSPITTTNNNSN
jgi:hypothetical protein